MRRLLLIAVLWGVALLPVTAQAQRGMGFRGGASPARVGSGFAARPSPSARPMTFAPRPFSFAPRPMPGSRMGPATVRPMAPMRMTSPRGRVAVRGQHAFAPQHGIISFGRFHHRFRHHRRFFFNDFDADDFGCFNGFNNFGCVNPFFFGGFPVVSTFDPFFFSSDWQQQQPQEPVAVEENNQDQELAAEVQELSDEIQSMRDEQRSREAQKSAAPQRDNEARPTAKDTGPNAILVMRDGLQLAVRNYAIANGTIWVLDQPKQKIPISKIDIAATRQINDKNGLEINLPAQ